MSKELADAILLEALYRKWIDGFVRDTSGRRAYFSMLGWVRAALAAGEG